MRPASHMPLAERITLLRVSKLIALDSSLDSVTVSPSNESGLMPASMNAFASFSDVTGFIWPINRLRLSSYSASPYPAAVRYGVIASAPP